MVLDRWIAAVFLVGAIVYAYAAFTYPLLPFERHMSFLPNTWPKVLSVIAILLSSAILLAPKRTPSIDGGDIGGNIDFSNILQYKVGQATGLIVAMILYAVALRPVGFLAATVLFLVATGWILGERKPVKMIAIACVASGIIWFLVQETLGIYLRPLPAFLG